MSGVSKASSAYKYITKSSAPWTNNPLCEVHKQKKLMHFKVRMLNAFLSNIQVTGLKSPKKNPAPPPFFTRIPEFPLRHRYSVPETAVKKASLASDGASAYFTATAVTGSYQRNAMRVSKRGTAAIRVQNWDSASKNAEGRVTAGTRQSKNESVKYRTLSRYRWYRRRAYDNELTFN